jgi:hypothetical protein
MHHRSSGWERQRIGARTALGRGLSPITNKMDLRPGKPVILLHDIHGQFLGTVLPNHEMDVSHVRTDTLEGDELFVHRKTLGGGGEGLFPEELREYRPVSIKELEEMGFHFMHKR